MSNFKKNIWMYGIIGVCIVFAVMMGSLGIMASHHHFDLVVSDYYKEEINYQKQINKINNYKALLNKPKINIDSIRKRIVIQFPGIESSNGIAGRICLYRPDNQMLDDTLPLVLDKSRIADISLIKYKRGKWRMQMEWEEASKVYFVEKIFMLN
jgi:hypothetical protein